MQKTKELEKFGTVLGISGELADDTDYMAFVREDSVRRWHQLLAENGGTVVAEPIIRIEPNMGYGSIITVDGEPMVDDDGNPVIDHEKEYLFVSGWATRS